MNFIRRSAETHWIDADDGGRLLELSHPDNSAVKAFSTARVIVAPGVKAMAHSHALTEEVYYIISGSPTAFIDGQVIDMEPGDALCIPVDAVHHLENLTDTAVEYLAISSPGFDPSDMIYPAL